MPRIVTNAIMNNIKTDTVQIAKHFIGRLHSFCFGKLFSTFTYSSAIFVLCKLVPNLVFISIFNMYKRAEEPKQ